MTDIPCDDQVICRITPDQDAAVRRLLAAAGALDLAGMLLGEGAMTEHEQPDDPHRIIERCKGPVYIEVNDHRGIYQTVEDWLESEGDIPADIRAEMIRTGTVVSVQAYPDTPIGSYTVHHHNLDAALNRMVEILEGGT